MKETELMIGDYLYWGKDKIVKVQMIRKYGDNFGVDAIYNDSVNLYFCTDNDDIYSYNIDELKPIPLTSDILEKNGWASMKNGSGDFILTNPMVGNDATITKTINGYAMIHGVFNGLVIRYVHELQHVLSICKIKKEIIL